MPGNQDKAGCSSFSDAVSGDHDANLDRRTREGVAEVAEVSAKPNPSPAYHCVAGVGFRIKAGENLLRSKRPLAAAAPLYLETSGTTIVIEERGGILSRYNGQNPGEHPLALAQDSNVYFFPGVGVEPPRGDNTVRDKATWRFDLGVKSHSVALSISFPAADASAGMAFLERLEFVEPEDPRCSGGS